jgi:hypothetical protein
LESKKISERNYGLRCASSRQPADPQVPTYKKSHFTSIPTFSPSNSSFKKKSLHSHLKHSVFQNKLPTHNLVLNTHVHPDYLCNKTTHFYVLANSSQNEINREEKQ